MIIDTPTLNTIKRHGKFTQYGAACLFLIALLLGIYAFYPTKPQAIDERVAMVTLNNDAFSNMYTLESSALLISSEKEELRLPEAVKDISVIAISSRPDAIPGKEKILLYIKQGGQGVIASPNEKIFLSFIDGKLQFSDFTTPISLRCSPLDACVKMEISLWLPVEGKDRVITDQVSYTVSATPHKGERMLVKEFDGIPGEVLEPISNMEWWGKDELIAIYGGETYKDQIHKERLVLGHGKEILFVEKDDHLFWNGRRWQVLQEEEQAKGEFVARVRSASGNRLEIDVWGKEGLFKQPLVFQKQTRQIASEQMEKILTRIRQRTSSRVSCKLAGKNAIVKNGDWILNKGKTWKVLRSLEEIESFLSFQSKGELFVADGVEKEDGKSVLKGHLFDETRSHVREITLSMKQKETPKGETQSRMGRRQLPMDDFEDDFDDDFDDEDDDNYDKNSDYLHLMNARRRHAISDDY